MEHDSCNESFKIPLQYTTSNNKIETEVSKELELLESYDASANNISDFLYGENTFFNEDIKKQLISNYSTDVNFLKEQQLLLKNFNPDSDSLIEPVTIQNLWEELNNEDFIDKYNYVDWKPAMFLNKSPLFLQLCSLYSLSSPVISFFVPFIILILPFFILQAKQIHISWDEYYNILTQIARTNQVFRLFTDFQNVDIQNKIYLLISATFYVFSIYQNIMLCHKFYNNMHEIKKYFTTLKEYLLQTMMNMEYYYSTTLNLSCHHLFNEKLIHHMQVIDEMLDFLNSSCNYSLSIQSSKICYDFITKIGNILHFFYMLHDSDIYKNTMKYTFHFNGYYQCLFSLKTNLKNKQINYCKFSKNKVKSFLKNTFYPPLKDQKPVKNNVKLNKNIIITGPNASGKTTILKTTFLNILFSQQFGVGFYSTAIITPYHKFHCYLNIPDTSGRDSLFQAEARRCKKFIDIIKTNPSNNHLCVFDELYSGTNPDEAISSAYAFLQFIQKNKNVSFILTTHYNTLCRKLDKSKNIANFKMESKFDKNKELFYTYKLKSGTSTTKGGINVLSKMNYPREIIQNASKTI